MKIKFKHMYLKKKWVTRIQTDIENLPPGDSQGMVTLGIN